MSTFWISVLVTVTVIIFFVISIVMLHDQEIKKIKDKQYLDNSIMKLKEYNFEFSKLILFDKIMYNKLVKLFAVGVDDKNKKIVFIDGFNCCTYVTSYDKLISYEIVKNGQQETSGNFGNAFIGGVLLGTTGAVIGASSKQTITEKITELKIIIRINDLQVNQFVFDLITSSVIQTDETYFKSIFQDIEAIKSLFEFVKFNVEN